MDLRQATRLRENPLAAWGFAMVAFLAALAWRFALTGEVPFGIPFLTFFPAIMLTAFLSGLWPAIAITIASALAAWYYFIPPFYTFDVYPSAAVAILLFLAVSLGMVAIIHFMHNSLARLDAEKARSTALAEQRELLFRELQHRISNNLAIVSALLTLQRAEVEDEKAKQALTEAATRLTLISKIHRKLHNPAGEQLRFGPFVEDLCHDVLEAAGAGNVVCRVSAVDAAIPSDKLIPLALIVTELISNALEHGFADRARGTIRIDFTSEGAGHVLTIADDGNGLPEGFSLEGARSLGLRIVQALVRQLDGTLAMENRDGTTCRLAFSASGAASVD